jgi:ubiquinone/menaquinone biosynthesis C-methylase UbiE
MSLEAYGTVLSMIQAHVGSRLLGIAAKLGIPDLLAAGATRPEALAELTGLPPRSLFRLMRGFTTCGIVRHRDDGAFELSELGECLKTGKRSLRDLAIRTHDLDHAAWDALLDSMRVGGAPFRRAFGSDFYGYLAEHGEHLEAFHHAMALTSAGLSRALVEAMAFPPTGTVVDVGGGKGISLVAILRAHPDLRGVLFDLPPAVGGAKAVLAAAALTDRCQIVAGDMFREIPAGGDLYLLQLILHNWSDERAAEILRQCRRAMTPAARLLIAERLMPERADAEAAPAIASDLEMLVLLGGAERTEAEYAALLAEAGFETTGVTATACPLSLLEARPR